MKRSIMFVAIVAAMSIGVAHGFGGSTTDQVYTNANGSTQVGSNGYAITGSQVESNASANTHDNTTARVDGEGAAGGMSVGNASTQANYLGQQYANGTTRFSSSTAVGEVSGGTATGPGFGIAGTTSSESSVAHNGDSMNCCRMSYTDYSGARSSGESTSGALGNAAAGSGYATGAAAVGEKFGVGSSAETGAAGNTGAMYIGVSHVEGTHAAFGTATGVLFGPDSSNSFNIGSGSSSSWGISGANGVTGGMGQGWTN